MESAPLLFTPGPLTTSATVKQAMLRDVGSRDHVFMTAVQETRDELMRIGGVSKANGYECVLMQGSGTFGVESVLSSILGEKDCLLILSNGAYGERIVRMAKTHKLSYQVLAFEENTIVSLEKVQQYLDANPGMTHLACIHSETTTGLFNPVKEVGALCKERGLVHVVDAMSSFGGVQMDVRELNIDFLISSSNKCIEGVPGFSFVICKRQELEKAKGRSRTLSLDLYDQWAVMEATGQFRFTPPTLSIMAFRQALRELEMEGGVSMREKRYKENKRILDEGMKRLGFKEYLIKEIQGHIITSFLYPEDPAFDFEEFYSQLSDRGFVIYPGKLSKAKAFRIGNIGQIYPKDVRQLIETISEIYGPGSSL